MAHDESVLPDQPDPDSRSLASHLGNQFYKNGSKIAFLLAEPLHSGIRAMRH